MLYRLELACAEATDRAMAGMGGEQGSGFGGAWTATEPWLVWGGDQGSGFGGSWTGAMAGMGGTLNSAPPCALTGLLSVP